MDGEDWQLLETCGTRLEAELIAGRLRVEGIPLLLRDRSAIPGLEQGCQLLVPSGLVHRARWLLAQEPPSEAELDALARSQPPPEDA